MVFDVSLSVLLVMTRNCEIALCTLMRHISDDNDDDDDDNDEKSGHSSHGLEDQGQRSRLGRGLESQFETQSVGPRSSVEDSFCVVSALQFVQTGVTGLGPWTIGE